MAHIAIDQLANEVNKQLTEYAELSSKVMKRAVNKAGRSVKETISETAPRKSGRYAESWKTKKTRETHTDLQVTVYSPTRYMLAHLLEHGHAKRNGGRVSARPHILPAQTAAEEEMLKSIEKGLKHG